MLLKQSFGSSSCIHSFVGQLIRRRLPAAPAEKAIISCSSSLSDSISITESSLKWLVEGLRILRFELLVWVLDVVAAIEEETPLVVIEFVVRLRLLPFVETTFPAFPVRSVFAPGSDVTCKCNI